MWQRLGFGAIILLSICVLLGSGILIGTVSRKEDKNKNFLVGFGLGLFMSGFFGLMVMAGLTA